MENNFDHIDELIGKHLAQETDAQEKAMLDAWLNENDANKKHFAQVKTIFDSAASVKAYPEFDTDEAWNKLKSKLIHASGRTIPFEQKSPGGSFRTAWRIAASLLLIASVGYILYRITEKPIDVMSIASVEQTVQDTLPDGSVAFLNKGSSLTYQYNPGEKTRSVKFEGEAFFEINHDEEKQFVIETIDVIIEDIGTSFNVKAYPESPTVEVYVESGEVDFYTNKKLGIRLAAGETGVYHRQSQLFERIAKPDTNVLSYKTRVFNFYNSDLGSVVENLNEVYETKIRLADPAIESCRLNVTFKGEPIEIIAEIIAETLSLKLTTGDGEIILDGSGCAQ